MLRLPPPYCCGRLPATIEEDVSVLKFWLWLTSLAGLTNQTRLALLRHFGTPEDRLIFAASHAGYATQNVSLVCAAEGLGNVVIWSFTKDKSPELLNLGKGSRIMMAHLIGVLK